VLVVLPLRSIPTALRRLREASEELQGALGAPVSINPLPPFRLRRPGRTLVVWKALREGVVLSGELQRARIVPPLEPVAARSYARSGIRYLVEHVDPDDLDDGVLPDAVARDVRKALLHAMQLRLLSRGDYASSIPDAIARLEAPVAAEMESLVARADRLETWRRALALLAPWVRGGVPWRRELLADLQYLALSALAGRRPHPIVLLSRSSMRARLAGCVELLAASIRGTGELDDACVLAAARRLPAALRPSAIDFAAVRDVVEREWPLADPLVGW
jgi:hypothetical protein